MLHHTAYCIRLSIFQLFDLGLLIAALWYGGHLVLKGRMSGAHLISFLLYQIQLGENLQVRSSKCKPMSYMY